MNIPSRDAVEITRLLSKDIDYQFVELNNATKR